MQGAALPLIVAPSDETIPVNVFKRAQVLDYWRRGRSAKTIAYILQVPLAEVEALIDRWEKERRGPTEA